MKYNNSLHQFLPVPKSQEIPNKIPNIKNFLTANEKGIKDFPTRTFSQAKR